MVTKGLWNEVRDWFSKRQKAKAGRLAANENAGDGGEGDIFTRAGVAAE